MHNIVLSDQHLAVIDAALQEMPMRIAFPVISEINRQLNEAKLAEDDE